MGTSDRIWKGAGSPVPPVPIQLPSEAFRCPSFRAATSHPVDPNPVIRVTSLEGRPTRSMRQHLSMRHAPLDGSPNPLKGHWSPAQMAVATRPRQPPPTKVWPEPLVSPAVTCAEEDRCRQAWWASGENEPGGSRPRSIGPQRQNSIQMLPNR
eukprot:scaffold190068_cov31-Tisochrysis_lutea.AAC.3